MSINRKSIEDQILQVMTKRCYTKAGQPVGKELLAHNNSKEMCNAARERSRVRTLRKAYSELQKTLPSIPPDTKLSKLDVLVLASSYINQLTCCLEGKVSEEEPAGPTIE